VRRVFDAIFAGEWTPTQIAGFVSALRLRGETPEIVVAAAEALRSAMVPVAHDLPRVLDTCGTGGDGFGTLNLSTGAAIIAAAAGVPVAKHGNRSVSSRSGSADVLEALGANVELGPQSAARALEETGFTFLNARRFHPAMRHVARARAELKIRTLFNWLGPLANPARATHQLIGVADGTRARMVAEVLARLDVTRALVVHGAGGLDELSLEEGNVAHEVGPGRVAEAGTIEAASLGLAAAGTKALAGGSPDQNAAILLAILAGERGPRRDALVLNAAAALWVAEAASTMEEAVALASEQIDSGRAAKVLERFVTVSRALGED
jgi:anthranilate phosphoribosyltransferase